VLNGPDFAALLHRHGFAFATGVPCSLIETLIGALERDAPLPYVPAVREDVAVGLAAGAWLAGRRPVVLMQNSGLGTSMNALASMALMYGIPTLLVITWRGYQGKDAPEHILTGAITPQHLDLLGIPHRVLAAASASDDLGWAVAEMDRLSQPVALLVPPGVFGGGHEALGSGGGGNRASRYVGSELRPFPTANVGPASISRFAAIRAAVKALSDQPVVHANGYPSRESHAVLDRPQNFYMIGSMGLASAIGLGVSLNHPARHTVVFDGDGNLLMNLGILAMVGARAPERIVHCVFDNEVYGSTGNQGSPAPGVRLDRVAAAAGYRTAVAATSEEEISRAMAAALSAPGPHFILAKVTAAQADVPRIAHTPAQIRDRFRAALASS
jgi:phosphonopyruvate decarboxylase